MNSVTIDYRKQLVLVDTPTVTWSQHKKSNCVVEIRATAIGGTGSSTFNPCRTALTGMVLSDNCNQVAATSTICGAIAQLQCQINSIVLGNGTVTDVDAENLSPLFTVVVNTPTSTPQIVFSQISQNENLFYASPNGSAGNPLFRSIVADDLGAGGDASKVLFGDMTWSAIQSSDVQNQVDYPIIGYMGLEHTYEWTVPVEWTYPGEFIIVIDENWNFVGSANNLTNLLVLLNDLGLGVFTTAGGIITVIGNHEYGDILELTGSEVAPSGVLAIDMAAPAAILDVLGFSTRRISQNQLRATDAAFINAMTPCDFKFGDPWPDPHSHWYHVEPLGGGDGPNYDLLEIISMGKTLANTQDGIGDVVYGYDWFLDFANTMQALGITEANVSLNVLALLIQQIKTYEFDYLSVTTSTDPGSGNFNTNNSVISSATRLYISKLDSLGVDISARILGWTQITLYRTADVTDHVLFDITAVVDSGTFMTLTISLIDVSSVIPPPFLNTNPVTFVIVEEASPDPVNANLINYTDFYDEVDFIVSHLASKGITVRLFQFILEVSIGNLKPAVHSTADYTTVVAKTITDYFIPTHPTIERSTDAVSVQETSRFADFNADVALLDVELARQYFHFWDYLTTYQDNRDRMTEYPTVCDLFESVFPYFNMMITQAPCKGGNPFRNKVGEGLIFSEFCMWVLEENLTRGNLTTGLNFYDASRLINGTSSTIYAATYFVQLLTDMFKNDGAVTGTFTDVPQSSSLHYVTVKRGLTAEVYVINPTAFPITVSTVTVNGVAKNVSVESYYGDPSSDTASSYVVALGTSALFQPFSLTKVTTL